MAKKNTVPANQFNGIASDGFNKLMRSNPMGLAGISDEDYVNAANSITLRKKRKRYLKSIKGYM